MILQQICGRDLVEGSSPCEATQTRAAGDPSRREAGGWTSPQAQTIAVSMAAPAPEGYPRLTLAGLLARANHASRSIP